MRLLGPSPGGGAPPPGAGGEVATIWNIADSSGNDIFRWDHETLGWDDSAWAGSNMLAQMMMLDSIELSTGYQSSSFERVDDTTRTNKTAGVDEVAADTAAFDWIAGPTGDDRYCLRLDEGKLILPLERNFGRRRGAISFWFYHDVDVDTDTALRVFCESGPLSIYKPASSDNLCFQFDRQDGTAQSVVVDLDAEPISQWLLVTVGWDRTLNKIVIYLNDTKVEQVTSGRFAQLNDDLTIGQNEAATSQWNRYIVDFRIWDIYPTDTLVNNLYLIKA